MIARSPILEAKEGIMPSPVLLIPILLWTLLTTPGAVPAADGTLARVGLLVLDERECGNEPLRAGLRALGHREGLNLRIDCRHGGGHYEGLAPAAVALVRARPAVIVALTHPTAAAAQQATSQIPIVFIAAGDPVLAGFALSLARPGRNMTGFTCYAGGLNGKRLELLQAMAPGHRRVAVLSSPVMSRSFNATYVRDLRRAADQLGLEIALFEASGEQDLEGAFAAMVDWGADALYLLPTVVFAYEAQAIADLAKWHGLPTMHWYKPFVTRGGLMAYGVDYPALQRRAAVYVDKILAGSAPAELPIEQPTHYDLVVNAETARELGLAIPLSIALRAARILE
ncbi:MAG: ABC transporter substrate-binding protein [Sphingobacteriia bacterium]|nr:ABC transporter substrate-binding protein [Sphingobacteriia bacterium]NCC39759.1 ABC transporter substrate-binding protein [Gammaproteobacteria bacterium]